MGIELMPGSWLILVAFGCYLVGVAALGIFAHRYLTRGSFVKEYFLGNRGLGPWVLALTVAATAISGGTFMGFPSLIYTNGWVMALWICSYMVVPLTTMALMGKRINQVSRIAGSVTVPDVLRDRFQSPALGILASLIILSFLTVNLVGQFKAGGLVMQEAIGLVPARATFVGAKEDKEKNLILDFVLPDGSKATQKTPKPAETAIYLPSETVLFASESGISEQVLVRFQVGSEVKEKKVRFPAQRVNVPGFAAPVEKGYILGLILFALTVVAYTTYGGFWAVTWTDVLEGVVMLVGVVLMAILAVRAVEPVGNLTGLSAATERLRQIDPNLVVGPGPKDYLPFGLAFSFFLMWSLMAAGQPSGMVRLMSFRDSASLRRALLLVCGYYILTYMSLLIIFVCARSIFPDGYLRDIGTEGQPDRIMPAMARHLAHPLVAGLLMAAPYAAIMSTVAAFLLMISSSLVRDLLQRTIHPDISPKTMKLLSYLVTGLVGLLVMTFALDPPDYLQSIIVFTGSSQGSCFLVPMMMCLYWPRATREGVIAAMLGGCLSVLGLWIVGKVTTGKFEAYILGGLDPLVWGLGASLLLGVVVSLLTEPDRKMASKYFPTS